MVQRVQPKQTILDQILMLMMVVAVSMIVPWELMGIVSPPTIRLGCPYIPMIKTEPWTDGEIKVYVL